MKKKPTHSQSLARIRRVERAAMNFNMKKLVRFAMFCMVLVATAAFVSCSDDDEASSGSLVGRSFSYKYVGVDGDGNPEEDTTTLTFKSETQCEVNTRGYCYIWSDGYKREHWNDTYTCRYSVSGKKITLHNYPLYAWDGDAVFTYHGSYLVNEGGDVYK